MYALYSTVSTVVVATLLLLLGTPNYGYTQPVQVNKGAALARGLTDWYKAIPGLTGSSRIYDLMGGPPLLMNNMGAGSGLATTGRQGGAAEIRFDGSDDQLATPTTSGSFPGSYTITLWVKLTGTPPGDYALLWEAVGGTGSLFLTSTGSKLATYTGSASIDPAATTLAQQVWYHVGLVVSAAQIQLYLNCQVDGSTGSPGTIPATPFQHTFGSKSPPASRFTGTMDDLRFYSRALSQSDMCLVMRQSMQGDPVLLPRPDPIAAAAQALVRKDRFFPNFQR